MNTGYITELEALQARVGQLELELQTIRRETIEEILKLADSLIQEIKDEKHADMPESFLNGWEYGISEFRHAIRSLQSTQVSDGIQKEPTAKPLEWVNKGKHHIWGTDDSEFAKFGILEHSVGPAGFEIYFSSHVWQVKFWHGNRGHSVGSFFLKEHAKIAAQKHADSLVASVAALSSPAATQQNKKSCNCGKNEWRDFFTGPNKTHDICASCGEKHPIATTSNQSNGAVASQLNGSVPDAEKAAFNEWVRPSNLKADEEICHLITWRAACEWQRAALSGISPTHAPDLEELQSQLRFERSHIQYLQRALKFWLPMVPAEPEEIMKRAGDDAMLLVGYEGEDEPSAEQLGWINLNAAALLKESMDLMTWLHGKAKANEESPDMEAIIPGAEFSEFVDRHANLMYRIHQANKGEK